MVRFRRWLVAGCRDCAMPEVFGTTCLQVSWTRSDDSFFPVYIHSMHPGGIRSMDHAPTRDSLAAISPDPRVGKPASAALGAARVQSSLVGILMAAKAAL